MRATVSVQDDLMQDLIRFTGAATKTAAVNEAIAEWVRFKKRQKIKALRGKLHIDGDLAALRDMELDEGGR